MGTLGSRHASLQAQHAKERAGLQTHMEAWDAGPAYRMACSHKGWTREMMQFLAVYPWEAHSADAVPPIHDEEMLARFRGAHMAWFDAVCITEWEERQKDDLFLQRPKPENFVWEHWKRFVDDRCEFSSLPQLARFDPKLTGYAGAAKAQVKKRGTKDW